MWAALWAAWWSSAVGLGCGLSSDAGSEASSQASAAAPALGGLWRDAGAEPVSPEVRRGARSLGAPPLKWRFRASAPSSGPAAVGPDGSVYLSTVEGYVHAVDRSGRFQWSYTVSGMPVGGPHVGPDGTVYVATASKRLYALTPQGRLGWARKVGSRPASELFVLSGGCRGDGAGSGVAFGSTNGRVYCLGAAGRTGWNRYVGQVEALAVGEGGLLGVATRGRKLVWIRGGRLASALLPAPPAQGGVGALESTWLVAAQGELLAYARGRRQARWRAQARWFGVDEESGEVVVERAGELVWLNASDGRLLGGLALPEPLSEAPVGVGQGVVLAPLVSGSLFVAQRDTLRSAVLALGHSPLRRPTLGRGALAAVASGGGELFQIDLSRWLGASGGAAPADGARGEEPSP